MMIDALCPKHPLCKSMVCASCAEDRVKKLEAKLEVPVSSLVAGQIQKRDAHIEQLEAERASLLKSKSYASMVAKDRRIIKLEAEIEGLKNALSDAERNLEAVTTGKGVL